MVGVPVAGKQLGCRTVFVVEAWMVDKQDWVLGKAAVFVVAGSVFAAVAVVEEGHHSLAVAETETERNNSKLMD